MLTTNEAVYKLPMYCTIHTSILSIIYYMVQREGFHTYSLLQYSMYVYMYVFVLYIQYHAKSLRDCIFGFQANLCGNLHSNQTTP